MHVCYCHSPFRYAWHERETALRELPAPCAPGAAASCSTASAAGTSRRAGACTHYIANSAITRERIGDFYGRDSVVVHPPVEVDRFRPASRRTGS